MKYLVPTLWRCQTNNTRMLLPGTCQGACGEWHIGGDRTHAFPGSFTYETREQALMEWPNAEE